MRPQNTASTCLAGEVYGRWTVLREGDPLPSQRRVWCRCECGTEAQVAVSSLRNGRSRSCGCLHAEVAGEQARQMRLRHGATRGHDKTPEYSVWSGMHRRCTNPKAKHFAIYGGRGITVCSRWARFEEFLADMGPRPGPEYSIERKDRNGNYEPGNCVWATAKVQGNNTSRNRFLEIRGERLTIAQWAERSGTPAGHIWARLNRGWDPSRAVYAPRLSRAEACRVAQRIRTEQRREARS